MADIDGTNHLFAVSCVTGAFCVAGDDHGDVVTSKDPTAGASAWTVAAVDSPHWILSLSCQSTSLCAAGDNAYDAVVGAKK
jgi:hypothetical protein